MNRTRVGLPLLGSEVVWKAAVLFILCVTSRFLLYLSIVGHHGCLMVSPRPVWGLLILFLPLLILKLYFWFFTCFFGTFCNWGT